MADDFVAAAVAEALVLVQPDMSNYRRRGRSIGPNKAQPSRTSVATQCGRARGPRVAQILLAERPRTSRLAESGARGGGAEAGLWGGRGGKSAPAGEQQSSTGSQDRQQGPQGGRKKSSF